MPGYLDQYGAGEEKRNRIIFTFIATVLTLVILVSLGWYLLKNHHQESIVKQFLSSVRKGDYASAYQIWGCTSQSPCKTYPFDKFQQDWAGKNNPPDPSILRISDSESCDNGVLLTVDVNRERQEKLWMEKSADGISFAPYPICPHKSPFAIMIHRTIGALRKPLLH